MTSEAGGSDPLNVLCVYRGQDIGGQGYRLAQAFGRHAPGWSFHSLVNPTALMYLRYPVDTPWNWDTLRELYAEADVCHWRIDWSASDRLERGKRKPAVIHYQGTNFRTLYGTRLRQQRQFGAIGLVSTLDLYLISPSELEWLPAPYDLEWLQSLRSPS